jgi:hypothetical protein
MFGIRNLQLMCDCPLGVVIESPVRSGFLPFLALTETLTSHIIFGTLQ